MFVYFVYFVLTSAYTKIDNPKIINFRGINFRGINFRDFGQILENEFREMFSK